MVVVCLTFFCFKEKVWCVVSVLYSFLDIAVLSGCTEQIGVEIQL